MSDSILMWVLVGFLGGVHVAVIVLGLTWALG